MDGRFFFDDAATRSLGRPLVALGHIDTLDQGAGFLGKNLQDITDFSLVPAGRYDDPVAFLDLQFRRHHSTSGAREMIFM